MECAVSNIGAVLLRNRVECPPEVFHPILKGMIMNEDNLVYNLKKVKQVFKHVFEEMKKFNKL